jgi:phosphopantetheinyl transferase
VPERLHHSCLPDDIIVGFEPLLVTTSGGDVEASHSITGSILLKTMANEFMDIGRMDVFTEKYEKPKAFVDEDEISVSFSHTDDALAASISNQHLVGLDMERISRQVNDRLLSRMRHHSEADELYLNSAPVRIWTLKESALKMIGTGLRKPMNSVIIKQQAPCLFEVFFDDGIHAKICSFQHQEHWVSICYHNNDSN